jgi:hypothetical protein
MKLKVPKNIKDVNTMTEQAVMENERRIQRFKEAVEKQKQ